MKRRKEQVPKKPSEGSPCARAKMLNAIALNIPLKTSSLPPNERRYVQGVHKVLIRYWHFQISKEQAQAEQRLWQISCLQAAGGDIGREGFR